MFHWICPLCHKVGYNLLTLNMHIFYGCLHDRPVGSVMQAYLNHNNLHPPSN